MGCCVIPLKCGGSGVCCTLGSCAGGVNDYCGTAMLKMSANCFSAYVFYPRLWMDLYGAGFWSASAISTDACVTKYAWDRLGNLFYTGKSSVMFDTRSDYVLGM